MKQDISTISSALLAAGSRLARRAPLTRITTAVIATEAGLPSVRFFEAYADLTEYLVDFYHKNFLEPVRADVLSALAHMPAVRERTQAAARAYLDFCLKHRGARRWTIEARAEPAFDTAYLVAAREFQALIGRELASLGFVDLVGAARLCAAVIYEISAVEMREGHAHDALRRCLWRLLEPVDRPVLRVPERPPPATPPPIATATPRQRLLRAGEDVLREAHGHADAITVERVLAVAGVDRETFDSNFGDLQTFEVAMVQAWTERYMTRCLAASQGLPPSNERLHVFLTAAWDCSLAEPGFRLLMKRLLQTDAELRARILARVQSFTRITAMEYQALGVASPQALARLFIAASNELVEVEESAGTAQPRLRETFWQIFDPMVAGPPLRRRSGKELPNDDAPAQTSFLTTQIDPAKLDGRRRARPGAEEITRLRQRLVEAGDHLLLTGASVDQLTQNQISLLSGVDAGQLQFCYPDFNAYLTDLMVFLLDEARDIAVDATAHAPPGLDRMRHGLEVYLDARLDRPATHELSRRLRGYAPAAKAARNRAAGFMLILGTEFRALGWADATEHGHLMTALTAETVQAEFEAGRRLPEYRGVIHDFLKRG